MPSDAVTTIPWLPLIGALAYLLASLAVVVYVILDNN
jgi:hypothetical protein